MTHSVQDRVRQQPRCVSNYMELCDRRSSRQWKRTQDRFELRDRFARVFGLSASRAGSSGIGRDTACSVITPGLSAAASHQESFVYREYPLVLASRQAASGRPGSFK